jgi:hypothetical protein
MLETTLSTSFIPGTNLKGEVAGANWSFLLPNLNLGRVVCLGWPAKATLTTLSSFGQAIIIACPDAPPDLKSLNQEADRSNLRIIGLNGQPAMPFSDQSVDLVLVTGRRSLRQLSNDEIRQAELQRLLKPEGLIYLDLNGPVDYWLGKKAMTRLARTLAASRLFWLTPLAGEIHTAVPASDQNTIDYFLHHHLYSPALKVRGFAAAERFLNKHLFASGLAQRYGALVADRSRPMADRPPQYLRSLAQEAGLEIDRYRWGLSARGEYSSRKVLFFLFKEGSQQPAFVVKMVRDPQFNARLENEARALRLLSESKLRADQTLPQLVFCGQHHGLAVVGETAIQGTPFRQRTQATAACSYGRSAVNWLIELGVATANPNAATPPEVAAGLQQLFSQFTAIYQLDHQQHAFLQNQINVLGCSTEPFPLVFQHGDPGTWNVLATPAGQAVFLDWEAAEPQGIPLWDLFYFLRSYSVWAARLTGVRQSLTGFSQQVLKKTDLSELWLDVAAGYCRRIGLDRRLVEPLFYTCWMHRALKEATRLKQAKLQNGHYVSLLRLCITQRDRSTTLQRLFS